MKMRPTTSGIGEHVEIIVVPFAEWARRGRALEDHARHSGLYLAILNLQPVHNDSAFSRCMPRESSNEKLLPFTTRWSTSAILHDLVNISRASLGFIGATGRPSRAAVSAICFVLCACTLLLYQYQAPRRPPKELPPKGGQPSSCGVMGMTDSRWPVKRNTRAI